MKNIHVLPTDKPSRLFTNRYSELKDHNTLSTMPLDSIGSNQHIYITSDVKKIKDGWYFNNSVAVNKPVYVSKENVGNLIIIYGSKPNHLEEIILTTDQYLIKNGVQAIDEEFLEWFVKNPSCAFVEVKPLLSNNGRALFDYRIIIPKEKPKQETLEDLSNELEGMILSEHLNAQEQAFFIAGFQECVKWQEQKQDNFALDFVCWLMENCELIKDPETEENVLWRYDSEDYILDTLLEIFKNNKL